MGSQRVRHDWVTFTHSDMTERLSLNHPLTHNMHINRHNVFLPLSCFNHPSHTFLSSLNFPNVSSSQGPGVSCLKHLDDFSHTLTQLTPFHASPSLCVSFFQEVFFLTKPLEWLSRHPQHIPGYTFIWALLTSRHLLVICPPLLQESRGLFVLLNSVPRVQESGQIIACATISPNEGTNENEYSRKVMILSSKKQQKPHKTSGVSKVTRCASDIEGKHLR